MIEKPKDKPNNPRFGSGPVRKPKGWSFDSLSTEMLGRSHRAYDGVALIHTLEEEVRQALNVPKDFKVAFLVGSATGAMEAALWNLIGAADVRIFDFDTFSNRWALDILEQLNPRCLVHVQKTLFGEIPVLEDLIPQEDLLFCYNGTTTGCMIPNTDWIQEKRDGLVFCDATSAAYCFPLDYEKLDVIAFSFQKGLGAEAGLGCLMLSPKAFDRLQTYKPSWGLPRLFRLKDGSNAVFDAKLLNTPSILTIEDILLCHWLFDQEKAYKNVLSNKRAFDYYLESSTFFEHPLERRSFQSLSTGIMVAKHLKVKPDDFKARIFATMAKLLRAENVALDIVNHAEQPPSLRIWLGPTIPDQDLEALFPWLEWAYKEALQAYTGV
ncbi:MAG: Phosphoserine aminotransferase [Holosporales bacterium]